MTSQIRYKDASKGMFFTVRAAEVGTTLLIDRIDILRQAVARTRARRPFGIEAWVVLPDHMHCVWTLPPDDSNYSERWGMIKSQVTLALRGGARFRAAGDLPLFSNNQTPIWRKSFKRRVLPDTAAITAAIERCWYEPVKHGFTETPEDWLFSSIHRDRRLGRHPA